MQPFSTARANQFVSDYTGGDFSDQLGLVTSNGNMSVEFFYAMVRIEDPTDPSQNGQTKTRLCVRKRPHGDRLTEAVRFISEQQAAQQFPREFAFFKQNRDVPTDGTPLSELPGITQSQISILVIHNVRCVEDLLNLSADHVGQIGMDARSAYALAQRWMKAKTSNGELINDAAKDAATKAELDRLREADQRKDALIASMQAQLDMLARMGANQGQGAMAAPIAATQVQVIDAEGMGDDAPSPDMFSGAQMVTGGNEDLLGDAPVPALPGLGRPKGR
jgi:hypothetical protein